MKNLVILAAISGLVFSASALAQQHSEGDIQDTLRTGDFYSMSDLNSLGELGGGADVVKGNRDMIVENRLRRENVEADVARNTGRINDVEDTADTALDTANQAMDRVSDISALAGVDPAALDRIRGDMAGIETESKGRDAILASRPALDLSLDQTFTLGVGIGYADGESAVSTAAGLKITPNILLGAHVGTDTAGNSVVGGASASFGW